MLRLENGGNYPTPIGAADRIDIVRGPASPIYGPSKTGGYMNFVPKTARAENGTYAAETTGDIEADFGEWGYKVLKGSVTGPGKIGDHAFGYSLYGEVEDSDSYYRNVNTQNALFSAAFDTDITSSLRTEFGGMYQDFKGQQNSGWNRITQDLIDHGTYITGNPVNNLDTNGDGKLSREEVYAANGGSGLTTFGSLWLRRSTVRFERAHGLHTCVSARRSIPDLALQNPGTTHLSVQRHADRAGRQAQQYPEDRVFRPDLGWSGRSGDQEPTVLRWHQQSERERLWLLAVHQVLCRSKTRSSFPTSFETAGRDRSRRRHRRRCATPTSSSAMTYGAEFWNRPDISYGLSYRTSTRLFRPSATATTRITSAGITSMPAWPVSWT